MNDCWAALAVAVMGPQYLTPEQAFDRLDVVKPQRLHKRSAQRKDLTVHDEVDMIKMKSYMTYQQIGAVYGMKASAVFCRIKRHKKIVGGALS